MQTSNNLCLFSYQHIWGFGRTLLRELTNKNKTCLIFTLHFSPRQANFKNWIKIMSKENGNISAVQIDSIAWIYKLNYFRTWCFLRSHSMNWFDFYVPNFRAVVFLPLFISVVITKLSIVNLLSKQSTHLCKKDIIGT